MQIASQRVADHFIRKAHVEVEAGKNRMRKAMKTNESRGRAGLALERRNMKGRGI
jgi:hypothetical protein